MHRWQIGMGTRVVLLCWERVYHMRICTRQIAMWGDSINWIFREFWVPATARDTELRQHHFLYVVPWLALLLLLLRSFVESCIAHPVGERLCGLSDTLCPRPSHNTVLWEAYKKNRSPDQQQVSTLASAVGWNTYQVQKWFWRARNYRKVSTLAKFKESFWRFIFYSAAVLIGVVTLSQEDFFWDHKKCYEGYPSNTPTGPVLRYWAIQMAFYCSLLVSHYRDARNKDFYPMLVHHVATIGLLLQCYTINFTQIGALIVLTHDVSDILLEFSKLVHYAKRDDIARVSFALFAVVFFIMRLVVLPFWLIWSVAFDLPLYAGYFPGLTFSLTMLLILQVLHIYWFSLIVGMAVRVVRGEEVEGDARSDSEVSSESDHDQ